MGDCDVLIAERSTTLWRSQFSLLRVRIPLRFSSDSAAGTKQTQSRGKTMTKTQHGIRARRSPVRRCLTITLVGLLTASAAQDVDAQVCQGGGMGGGGRMGGGQGGRGGGRAGGGAAGMMQMLQMAQQAQQARAMQQQSALAAMRQQQLRMQQLSGQQQRLQPSSSTDVARSGRSFSEARRNRFRQSRAVRAARMQRLARNSSATTEPDERTTDEQRSTATRNRRNDGLTASSVASQLARFTSS